MQFGINIENESSLHSQLKTWLVHDGGELESKVGDYVIDVVLGDLLIEVQTSSFNSIVPKIKKLISNYNVRLIYPIASETWLVYVNKQGKQLRRRKSPKKGDFTDLFTELIHVQLPFDHPNFSLEVMYIQKEEVRCDDGKGSWRRNGVSIVDHRLLEVCERVLLESSADINALFPQELPTQFTNRELANYWDISIYRVRMITYVLRQMGVVEHVGKRGREYLFETI